MALALVDNEIPVIEVITQYFDSVDGWLQPRLGTPLVRVRVSDGRYIVQRRRKPHTAWMSIVDIPVEEFDAQAFKTWVEHFRLTA
jgi:hypothetical protein